MRPLRAPQPLLDAHSLTLMRDLQGTIDPCAYVRSVGLYPFDWQVECLQPGIRRLILLSARQAGKSTVVAGRVLSKAKYIPESLILIICPAKDQSKNLMKKIDLYMGHDPELAGMLTHDAVYEKEFRNKSRIVALPGTERSVRSYSAPSMIVIDEGARVLDETYKAARPMLVGNPDAELILMSTPFGKSGFFFEEWTESENWLKIAVRVHVEPDERGGLTDSMPERLYRELMARQGVSGYYSPRHLDDVPFLLEEVQEASLGPYWFWQEYCLRFQDPTGSMFTHDDLLMMMGTEDVTPLLLPEKQALDDGVQPLEV